MSLAPEYFADHAEDGFWYVFHEDERPRPRMCRNPSVILHAECWPDAGEAAAHAIAAFLSDRHRRA